MLDNVLKGIIGVILLLGLIIVGLGLGSGEHEMTTEVQIDAPVEEVYEYVLSDENNKYWLPGYISSKLLSGEELQPGSKYEMTFEGKAKPMKMIETITEIIPNKQLSFDLENPMTSGHIDILFDAVDGGTKVTEVYQMKVKGIIAKAITRLSSGMMSGNDEMYQKLKRNIEK